VYVYIYIYIYKINVKDFSNRMPETKIVKRIYKWKTLTGRPAGRPKSRWEDVRDDLKKMKLMNWAEQVQDPLKWKVLSRRPRLYQSCSAIEEEEEEEEGGGEGGGGGGEKEGGGGEKEEKRRRRRMRRRKGGGGKEEEEKKERRRRRRRRRTSLIPDPCLHQRNVCLLLTSLFIGMRCTSVGKYFLSQ